MTKAFGDAPDTSLWNPTVACAPLTVASVTSTMKDSKAVKPVNPWPRSVMLSDHSPGAAFKRTF